MPRNDKDVPKGTRRPVRPLSRKELWRRYREALPRCERVLRALENDLRRRMAKLPLHAGLKSRVKAFPSYYRKYIQRVRDPADPDVERILGDLIGMRITCPFLEDVAAVERILRGSYGVDAVRRKMEDAPPDDFGYKATHLLIRVPARLRGSAGAGAPRFCEIQIRTTLQDAWAEVDHELVYKAGFSPFHEPLRRKLAALNANLTLADIVFQEVRDYQRALYAAMSIRRDTFRERIRRSGLEPSVSARGAGRPGAGPLRPPGSDGIDALLLEGLQTHNARSYAKAIRIYTRILDRKPGGPILPVVHVHRGMAYFARSMYRKALEDFLTAVAIDPHHAVSCYYAGAVYELMGDPDAAVAFFNRSLEADPAQIDSLIGRARILFRAGDRTRALADCEEALALDPVSKEALEWKARIRSSTRASRRRHGFS